MSPTWETQFKAGTRRICFIGPILALLTLAGWATWFFPYDDLLDGSGTPLGADFSMFYVAGQMAWVGEQSQLYNQAAHQTRLHQLFPNLAPEFCLPFRYPPLVARLLSPLGAIPYPLAYLLFAAASVGCWAFALRCLLREFAANVLSAWKQNVLWLGLLTWPIFLETLTGGQAALFSAGIAALTLCCLQHRRDVLAGVLLSLATLKPNVLLLFALGLVIYRPRVLWGAVPATLLLISSQLAQGPTIFLDYIQLSSSLAAGDWQVETPFWKVHSLGPWLATCFRTESRVVPLAFGLCLVAILAGFWRQASGRPGVDAIAASILLTLNALCNPYTPIYDLALLGPAAVLMLVGVAQAEQDGVPLPLGMGQLAWLTVFFGPHLSQAVAKSTGIQIFPLLLVTVLAWQVNCLLRAARNPHETAAAPGEPCVLLTTGNAAHETEFAVKA